MTRSTPGASRVKVKHTTGHRSRPELRGAVARRLAALALLVPVSALAAEQAPGLPLTLEADLPLPGDSSRFDYESYDAGRHLLFIAHLGQSELLVFDTRTRQVIKRIGGLRHVHGVLAIPELGRVYASATGTDEVVAIDEGSLTVVARMPGGTYPDGMAYAPQAGKPYVSDETRETQTLIAVPSHQRLATIPLGGAGGHTPYAPASRPIHADVPS